MEKVTRKQIIQYLKDVKDTLDNQNIKFWLEDGTLLGAVRNKNIIPWDHDIDLGSFKESFKSESLRKKVSKQLGEKGFSVYFFPNSIAIYKDDFHIDIILLRYSSDRKSLIINRHLSLNPISHLLVKLHKLSNASFYGRPRFKNIAGTRDLIKNNLFFIIQLLPLSSRRFIYKAACSLFQKYEKTKYYSLNFPANYFKYFKNIKFQGLDLSIPKDYKKYLKIKYGDWKVPPKDPSKWCWYKVGQWPKIETLLNRKNIIDE